MNDRRGFDSGSGARRFCRQAVLITCAILASGFIAGCGRYHHHGAKTPEEFRERFDRATQRALEKMDATEDQKSRIKPIADDLAAALSGFREERNAIRSRFIEAFEAEKVDPEAVAKIRADALALADRASRTMTEAIIKASDVLTPEQRRKLAERWKKCM
ncbi:MAG: periplasmic heavy metal sensor [Deltaproteobacteria bacterium]|nr:periplasmic heavy metal sensor [Deltaproteobacteria bacterium]